MITPLAREDWKELLMCGSFVNSPNSFQEFARAVLDFPDVATAILSEICLTVCMVSLGKSGLTLVLQQTVWGSICWTRQFLTTSVALKELWLTD